MPDYAKECRLLQRVVEAGVAKEIDAAANLDICKKQQVRHLKEELFMEEDMAANVVDMLSFVLSGDTGRTALEAPKPAPQKPGEALYTFSVNFQQSGPFSLEQLKNMIGSGRVSKDYWIRSANGTYWMPIPAIPELKSFFENVPSPAVVSKPDESKDVPPKYYHSSLPERIFCTVIGLIPIGICLFLLYGGVPIWQTFAPEWCPCFLLFLLSQSRQPARSAWSALSLHLALDSFQKWPDYVILAVL